MTPTEYEHHVAALLRTEGWSARVSPPQRDFGLDILCERDNRRLGVQVKMYGSGRPVNAQMVMQLHGAAAYQDCTEAMVATDGRLLENARQVAEKLGIEIRYLAIPRPEAAMGPASAAAPSDVHWTFDRIWEDHVMPLTGQVLTRPNGSTNEVVSVDWSGLSRRSSRGSVRTIDIEIFRWTIDRLLAGDVVLRDQINSQYPKRASSGIVLVLESLPMFETVSMGSKSGLRLRTEE